MAKLYNLARMTTTTTGTGTVTLAAAVTGFLTFALAGVQDGDVVSYAIRDGTNSEVGTGTYTAATKALTRTIRKSTNGNSAISLSGAAEVFITPAAEDLQTELEMVDGSVGSPSLSFLNETTTGFYRASAFNMGVAVGGVDAARFTKQGISFVATTIPGITLNNLTTAQQNAIAAPAAGNLIWNTTQTTPNYYDGAAWQQIAGLAVAQTFTADQQINVPGAAGTLLKITHNSSTNHSQSALDLHCSVSGAQGRLLQCFNDVLSPGVSLLYIDDGQALWIQTTLVVSGQMSGANINLPTVGISGAPAVMFGVFADIDGPAIISRPADTATLLRKSHLSCIDNNPTDVNLDPNMIWSFRIAPMGQLNWGIGATDLSHDTFLGRGNAAATIQLGGADVLAPVAQTLSANNVIAAVSLSAGANTAAGAAVVSFANGIPPSIVTGMTVTDSTTPSAIPGGTTVLSIASNRLSFTMSANAAGPGIAQFDTIVFSAPNVSGAAVTYQGSLSTGTGAGGTHIVANGFAGITYNAQAVTVSNGASATVTLASHGFVPGQAFQFAGSPVPGGTSALTNYYVIATGLTTGTFQFSATPGGAAFTTSSTGTTVTISTGSNISSPQNPASTVATWGPSGLTGSQTTSVLNVVQTWNTSGSPSALVINVTNIASGSSAKVLDVQVGGTSQVNVDKGGILNIYSTGKTLRVYNTSDLTNYERGVFDWVTTTNVLTIGAQASGSGTQRQVQLVGNSLYPPVTFWSDTGLTSGIVGISANGGGGNGFQISRSRTTYYAAGNGNADGAADTFFCSTATATWQFGLVDGATAVAQSLRVQSVAAGNANTAGANWTLKGSLSNGAGLSGDIIFQTGDTGAGSGTQNALQTGLTIKGGTAAGLAGSVIIGKAAIATNATDGFLYIPTCAGNATGTPTTVTGRVAIVWDTTNHKFLVYDGGWKGATAPGVWS